MSDVQLAKVKKILIGSFMFVLFSAVLGCVVIIRTVLIEDYCTKYAQEKIGEDWNKDIAGVVSREEYVKATGKTDYFGNDYSEANLGWYEVFKCENTKTAFLNLLQR